MERLGCKPAVYRSFRPKIRKGHPRSLWQFSCKYGIINPVEFWGGLCHDRQRRGFCRSCMRLPVWEGAGNPFPGLSVTPQNSQNKGLTKAVHKLLTGRNKLLTGLSRSIFPFFPDSSTRRKQRTIYRRIRKNQILPISFFRQKPQTKTWHFPNLFPICSQYYSLLLFMIWSIFFL